MLATKSPLPRPLPSLAPQWLTASHKSPESHFRLPSATHLRFQLHLAAHEPCVSDPQDGGEHLPKSLSL